MDPLSDPETLRNCDSVAASEERATNDRETFEYFMSVDGMVAVGVRSDSGGVLLMDSPHGWRLPYAPVGLDDDWVDVARRAAVAMTGEPVDIAATERISRIVRQPKDGDGETITHDVVLSTRPVAGHPVADDSGFKPWDDLTVGWFDEVPEGAYWDHDDAVEDIQLVLGP